MSKKKDKTDQKKTKLYPGAWEIRVRDITAPLPMYMKVPALIVVDTESLYVFGISVLVDEAGDDEIARHLDDIIAQAPMLPEKFLVPKELFEIVKVVAEKYAIGVEIATRFPAITEVVKNANQAFSFEQESSVESPIQQSAAETTGKRHADRAPVDEKKTKTHTHGKPTDTVYQFKVSLNHIKPACWRRIQVPSDYSFGELAMAILDAFDRMFGYHVHNFSITNARGGILTIGILRDDGLFNDDLDEGEEYIADYFGKKIGQCIFTYDFGDDWIHTVLFEGEFPAEVTEQYPKLLTGKGNTPPEDCGGPGGYEHILRILKDPKHSEHGGVCEWLGIESADEYFEQTFDPEMVEFQSRKEYKKHRKNYGKHF